MKFRRAKLAHFWRTWLAWFVFCEVQQVQETAETTTVHLIWHLMIIWQNIRKNILSGQIWVLLLSQEIIDDDARDHSLTTHVSQVSMSMVTSGTRCGHEWSRAKYLQSGQLASWHSVWFILVTCLPKGLYKGANTSFSLFVCIPCMYDDGKGWYLHTRLLPSCISVNEGQK